MKITTVLMLVFMTCVYGSGKAQKVSLSLRNAKLEDAFKEISRQTSYKFLYSDAILEKARRVDVRIESKNLNEALTQLLESNKMAFKIIDGTITINRKTEKNPSLPNLVIDAQNRISGVITNAEGLPLAGATVAIKGSSQGTMTDAKGTFSIQANAGAILIIRYIGYLEQEVAVRNQNNLRITLVADDELDEVVVVAYGTQRKEAITGSVATVSSKELEKRVITNLTSALAGAAPGIGVSGINGQPGSSASVRIRGFGSYSVSSSPLYVVDGAVYEGSIGDIPASDIESLTILKDATSTALYGSRGGNGVIIITTKKGVSETPTLSLTLNKGFTSRGIPEYERVNTLEYYPLMWEAMKNSVKFRKEKPMSDQEASQYATDNIASQLVYNPFNVDDKNIVGVDGKLNPNASLLYDDFNWYDAMTRQGHRDEANLSVSNKKEKSDYYSSLSYLRDDGYILKSDFKRFSGRVNVNSEVKDWLKFGLNVAGSTSEGNLARDASTDNAASFVNPFMFIRGIGPIYPVHAWDKTGNAIIDPLTGKQYYDAGMHPGAVARPTGASQGRHVIWESLLNDVTNKRNSVSARTFTEVSFLKHFKFKPSVSADFRNGLDDQFRSPEIGDGATLKGYSYNRSHSSRTLTFNQILYYEQNFNKHYVSAFGGHENYEYKASINSSSKTNQILAGNTKFDNFVTPYSAGGYEDVYRLESYFSKAAYNYDNKYFFDASLRRDGSSRFHKDSRWGTFYSLGGAWSISKENFMQNVSWINDLRLKASLGAVGNDALSTYYAYQAFYSLGFNNGSHPGLLLSSLATPDLTWEASKTYNVGLNFSLLKNRVFGEIELYKRGSDDLIFALPLALSDPVTTINANIGSLYNKGLEIQLGGEIIRKQDFNWRMITNWTFFKNEITKMPAENPVITSGTKRREVGRDVYSFWLRDFQGVDPADGSSLYTPVEGTAPEKIRTVNGREYVTTISDAKYDYFGTAIPNLIGSVQNTFSYKDFSLSFLINYQLGGKFYDGEYAGLMNLRYGSAMHADQRKAWTTPGQITDIPRLDMNATSDLNAASNRWLIDASYISFSNVNVAYNLPKNWINRIDLRSARIFFSGENLGMISKRKGLNPLESFDGTNSTTYGLSKIFSFGLNVAF
ncbi:TonB-dependent receptor [Sphingobacterium yanglingense]|nr:TonB-dependent receptor [Sphingobacterium yanglingense]